MLKYLTAVKKCLVYLTLPIYLSSCAQPKISPYQKKPTLSPLEKITNAIRDYEPPKDFDSVYPIFNQRFRAIRTREYSKAENCDEVLSLQSMLDNQRNTEHPDYEQAIGFLEKMTRKALSQTAESYFRQSEIGVTVKDLSSKKNRQMHVGIKPSLYSGSPDIRAFLELDNLWLINSFRADIGTRRISLKAEKQLPEEHMHIFGIFDYKNNRPSFRTGIKYHPFLDPFQITLMGGVGKSELNKQHSEFIILYFYYPF
jgi:hypothetical protein